MEKIVSLADTFSSQIAEILKSYFLTNTRILILFCGYTQGLAKHLTTLLKIVDPSKNILIMPADYAHNVLLPYISDDIDLVLLLSSKGAETCLARASSSLAMLGIKSVVLTTNLPQNYKRYIYTNQLIEIPHNIFRLALLQGWIKLVLELKGSSARIE
ncbi:MAG TPA: hypothetical protein ENF93_00680, partial [Ignisphaera sp.]|nr:hypothetical protein [Ignisphaera sp.]